MKSAPRRGHIRCGWRKRWFDFVEMSVDETDARLARLDWSREQRLAPGERGCCPARRPCVWSAHRRFRSR